MAKPLARRWLISGTVQGVGFRFFVQHKATALGLTGCAKNLEDGRVQVYAAGSAEALDDLEAALHLGPNLSEVRSVNRDEVEKHESHSGFYIR